jgi:hypothetical protein
MRHAQEATMLSSETNKDFMPNGVCPKCFSTEVYRGTSTEGEGLTAGSYNSIVELSTDKTQTTLWIDTYICRACGYLEMRVANHEDLNALPQAEGWEKVSSLRKLHDEEDA